MEGMVVKEGDNRDLTATIKRIRTEEDQRLSLKKIMLSMEEVLDHSMVVQVLCEDHHMEDLVMVQAPWVTLPSMRSTSSTMPTCSSRHSTTLSTPCSCSSTMHSTVVTHHSNLLPLDMLVDLLLLHMDIRVQSKRRSEYL